MNKLPAFVFMVSLVVVTGCAPMPSAINTLVHPGPIPEILPDNKTGVVTFYRPKNYLANGISFFVQENGQNVGGLKNGTYFSLRTNPGSHTYTAATSSVDKDEITIVAAPNKTNYVEASLGFGRWAGEPHLKETPAVTAKSEILKLNYIELKAAE